MSPHADAIWIGVRIFFHGGDSVKHINRVIGVAVCTAGCAFRLIVPAIIRAEDDITVAGDQINVCNILFSSSVHIGCNIAMIEDDDGPASRWLISVRYSHQRINLQAFGEIGNIIAAVINTGVKNFFDDNVTAGIITRAHGADLKRIRGRCCRWKGS